MEKANKRPYTIAVEGNIGSGKTTFLQIIQDTCFIPIDVVSEPILQWQNCQGNNLLELLYNDPHKNAITFQSYAQLTKLQSYQKPTKCPLRIMERSLFSARYCFVESLYHNGYITQSEYAVLDEWFKYLTHDYNIDLIIYLRTDPNTSFNRILTRGRKEETNISLKYIQQLHKLHDDWLFYPTPSHHTPPHIKIVDVTEEIDTLKSKISFENICTEFKIE